jgi:uncharacterized protein YggL (DUF469 family)
MSAPCPILGFMVVITLLPSTSDAQADALTVDLAELLEANGMMMGGGGDRTLELAITREGTQATDADRQLVAAWAARWASAATVSISDLVDLA